MIFMFFETDEIGGINGIGFNGRTGVERSMLAVEASGGNDIIGEMST